ncbi:alpha-ribazole phosphatase [Leucothrix sargassi]|nr:alpha-ribazole phosphatase [Leucothrix sargassi]
MSETTMITLLRHGEVELGNVFCGSTDPALSDNGWSQMQKAIEDEEAWDKVLSSPLQRCSEFAESLATQEELEFITDERFQEIDFGDWDGISPQEILDSESDTLNAWWKSPTKVVPPNGEAFLDFRSRVLKAFHEISEKHAGENLLLVTHAGVIRVILMHILGMQDENLFRLNVDYASISRIRLYKDETGEWGTLISHT